MVKKVLKFGGTSVGTVERIQHVANIIKKELSSGNKLIVVVSAMAGKTNELIKFSKEISEEFNKELDVLLSSGSKLHVLFFLVFNKIKLKLNLGSIGRYLYLQRANKPTQELLI